MRDSNVKRALPPVTDWHLEHRGDGRFGLGGDVSFETAQQVLEKSESLFRDHDVIRVDLGEVSTADSAGLALLLEWKARARQRGASIEFANIPEGLAAIAKTTEVGKLL